MNGVNNPAGPPNAVQSKAPSRSWRSPVREPAVYMLRVVSSPSEAGKRSRGPTGELTGGERPVDQMRLELAARLRARSAELTEAIHQHVRAAAPEAIVDQDPELVDGLRVLIDACTDCVISSVERGEAWSGPLPSVVAAHVRRTASSGIELSTALLRCVVSYTRAWQFVLGEAMRTDLDERQRSELLGDVSSLVSSVLVALQREIVDIHLHEIKIAARSREQRRAEIARRLLAGGAVQAGEIAELDYQLDGWHLGMIVSGRQADKAASALAARTGRALLTIARGEETVWAWLGGVRTPLADAESLVSANALGDVSLALGEPASGLEGWRRTHREAQAALTVARYTSRSVTRYLDVALEATALQDDQLADSLIRRYLLPLDDRPGVGCERRRLLRAFFAAEHNVSCAALQLELDRGTVRRRLKEIETRLGCRLHERQAEIEIALRVEQLRESRATD